MAAEPAIPDAAVLRDVETLAVELATLAGAEIAAALGTMPAVRYKTLPDDALRARDPVSEVDHRVETLIRARLGERFPEHDIIGEEIDARPGRDHDVVWAVDPIDGTANFVNGFPLYAASIGVLHRGRPIAGAIWCATSHGLRPGVYHARAGGDLCFDRQPIAPKPNPAVRRGLAGLPDEAPAAGPWDIRRTGSAAIECALTAAGILRVSHFAGTNLWDVAAGVALIRASGGEVRLPSGGGWAVMDRFLPMPGPGGGAADLRNWRSPMVLGRPNDVARMCRERPPP